VVRERVVESADTEAERGRAQKGHKAREVGAGRARAEQRASIRDREGKAQRADEMDPDVHGFVVELKLNERTVKEVNHSMSDSCW
jgi:hypothetical protein